MLKRKLDASGNEDKPAKKSKHSQTFKMKYTAKYPVLKQSLKGVNNARCTVCNSDFSVAHGGINDCRTHVEGRRHKDNFERNKNQCSITQMLGGHASMFMDMVLSIKFIYSVVYWSCYNLQLYRYSKSYRYCNKPCIYEYRKNPFCSLYLLSYSPVIIIIFFILG